jgi:glyoxylase-like metal-dependent hydrolase (beta-lactamase superfamily II)/ferredoxin
MNPSTNIYLLLLVPALNSHMVHAFAALTIINSNRPTTSTSLQVVTAAPKRLRENVEGVVYVNDKCINCAACSNFAPTVFQRAIFDNAHVVFHQPSTLEQILDARAAMSACPVAAIRTETLAQRRHRAATDDEKSAAEKSWTESDEHLSRQMALNPKVNGLDMPFPRLLLHHDAGDADSVRPPSSVKNVYNVGHHNERSFGATPYLVLATVNGRSVWLLVDTPKFSKSAVDAISSITGPEGPNYLFLTHVDDTADHEKWADHFPSLQRIFHQGDTGRYNWLRDKALDDDVELLLPMPSSETPMASSPLNAYGLDGQQLPTDWHENFMTDEKNDVVILHSPGHSPGSITLWKKPTKEGQPGIIFTGDHYAYSTRTNRMSGFPRYNSGGLDVQAHSLKQMLQLQWDIVAPGHGHPRGYGPDEIDRKRKEMEEAILDLYR